MNKRLSIISWFAAILLALAGNIFTSSLAHSQDSAFEKWKRDRNAAFSAFDSTLDAKFTAFLAERDSLFNDFVNRVDQKWDDKVYPTHKDQVTYSGDLESRTHIDFESGTVTAAILIDADSVQTDTEATQRLEESLEKSIETAGRVDPFDLSDFEEISGPPLLADQIVDSKGDAVTPTNKEEFVEELIKTQKPEIDTVVADDGKIRIRLQLSYKLVPDHIKRRATKFRELVEQFTRKYQLDFRLVMAIIHTESYFNPRATSYIPAFGLMQIVPGSGGVDAAMEIFGEKRLFDAKYLYDPRNNIELGSAYLHRLRFNYLKGIEDDQLAYPVVIASYNGGPGMVSQALTGEKKLSKVAGAVDGESFDSIVARLRSSLPAKETRDYVDSVLARMPLYDEWTGNPTEGD